MDFEFNYDFERDYQQPSIWNKRFHILLIFGILFHGVYHILSYLENKELIDIIVAISSLTVFLAISLFVINGFKPFVKPEQFYFKIANNNIYSKLGKYTKEREIQLNKIEKIHLFQSEIILDLKKEKSLWIKLHSIQNKNKRVELIQIMINLNTHISGNFVKIINESK